MTVKDFYTKVTEESQADAKVTKKVLDAMFVVLAELPTDEALKVIADGIKKFSS